MKFFVVFAAALAVASAGYLHAPLAYSYSSQHLPLIGANGVPVDTPAVQQATAAHLIHKAEAHARNGDYAVYAHAAPVVAATYSHAAPIVATSYSTYAAAPVVAKAAYAYSAPVAAAYAAPVAVAKAVPAAYATTLGAPAVTADGTPLETPEVVAAKANHFAAHAEAKARNSPIVPEVAPIVAAPVIAAAPVAAAYAAPVAVAKAVPAAYPTTLGAPAVTADGTPLETPEVVAAKANHFAAHAEAKARNSPIVSEVAPVIAAYAAPAVVAKAAYAYSAPVAAYTAYAAHSAPVLATSYSTYAAAPVVANAAYAYSAPVVSAAYAAPIAVSKAVPAAYPTTLGVPAVTADGTPLETPEVVAAKANHFAAHAEASARNAW